MRRAWTSHELDRSVPQPSSRLPCGVGTARCGARCRSGWCGSTMSSTFDPGAAPKAGGTERPAPHTRLRLPQEASIDPSRWPRPPMMSTTRSTPPTRPSTAAPQLRRADDRAARARDHAQAHPAPERNRHTPRACFLDGARSTPVVARGSCARGTSEIRRSPSSPLASSGSLRVEGSLGRSESGL